MSLIGRVIKFKLAKKGFDYLKRRKDQRQLKSVRR